MLKAGHVLLLLFAAVALSGCQGWVWQPRAPDSQRGRYAGVGIFAPGPGWRRQAGGQAQTPAAAGLMDDEAVIVLVDSRTGEVRSCGDLSGYCVGMNPWRTALAKAQQSPVDLTQHATASEVGLPNTADNSAAAAAADANVAASSR